jgi:hypothetical protein
MPANPELELELDPEPELEPDPESAPELDPDPDPDCLIIPGYIWVCEGVPEFIDPMIAAPANPPRNPATRETPAISAMNGPV